MDHIKRSEQDDRIFASQAHEQMPAENKPEVKKTEAIAIPTVGSIDVKSAFKKREYSVIKTDHGESLCYQDKNT